MRSDKCPVCHGIDIEGSSVTTANIEARQECSCTSCGATWIAVYQLRRQVVACRFGEVATQERTFPADPYRYALAEVRREARRALARGKTNGGCLPSAVGMSVLQRVEIIAALALSQSQLGEKS